MKKHKAGEGSKKSEDTVKKPISKTMKMSRKENVQSLMKTVLQAKMINYLFIEVVLSFLKVYIWSEL